MYWSAKCRFQVRVVKLVLMFSKWRGNLAVGYSTQNPRLRVYVSLLPVSMYSGEP